MWGSHDSCLVEYKVHKMKRLSCICMSLLTLCQIHKRPREHAELMTRLNMRIQSTFIVHKWHGPALDDSGA